MGLRPQYTPMITNIEHPDEPTNIAKTVTLLFGGAVFRTYICGSWNTKFDYYYYKQIQRKGVLVPFREWM